MLLYTISYELNPSINLHAHTMKPKTSNSVNPKLLLLGFFIAILLLFLLTSTYPSSSPPLQTTTSASVQPPASCAKIPPSLADTIIHYATLNITPQQTLEEISVTARVLARKSPCNFLVFGLGHDSLMWSSLNHGGRTVFLEEDEQWIKSVTGEFPTLEAYHAKYDTKVSQAEELMELGKSAGCAVVEEDIRSAECPLALRNLPSVFYQVEWNVIMVDAPTGYVPEAPGRMSAIYTAGVAARGRRTEGEADVFVHDVDRLVEDKYSREFLCEGYLKAQEGRIRHFTIPSHRVDPGIPFCP
ncbi:glucuronoxylan 4-O-methyltransferase 3-like [Canna indica]|uniref:Glucuronoxylan 4-O-methyltransferase 3-like n=1 Tax=Canna indica TaxID=4628 RepID=A0AAQ3KZ20_9LILI|nr:glucuronoxylan 4-O-methyltransferase 3-like [Canna indica]